jgi:hypothetical protein
LRCEQGPEVESDFEYEQNEEVNGILIQKLNKEIELEIERERETFRCDFILCLNYKYKNALNN